MSSMRISLNKDSYKPGDTVAGNVELSVTKAIKARDVSVTLRGEEIVRGPRGKSNTAIVDKTLKLTKGKSFPKDGKHYSVDVGKYKLPFSFKLPRDAAATFTSPNKRANVTYGVSARVDIPRARDITGNRGLTVQAVGAPKGSKRKVMFLPHDNSLSAAVALEMKPEIRFSCKLNKAIYKPGDKITGTVTIEDKDLVKDARAIEITLTSIEEVRSKLHHVRKGDFSQKRKSQKTIRIRVKGLELGTAKYPFIYAIPSNARPTTKGIYFDHKWFVEVVIDVPKAVDVKAMSEITILP